MLVSFLFLVIVYFYDDFPKAYNDSLTCNVVFILITMPIALAYDYLAINY